MAGLRVRTIIEFLLRGKDVEAAVEQLDKLERQSKTTSAEMRRAQVEAIKQNEIFDRLASAGYKPAFGAAETLRAKIDLLNQAQRAGVGIGGSYNAEFARLRDELRKVEGGTTTFGGRVAGIARELQGLGGAAGASAGAIAGIAAAAGPLALVVAAFEALKIAATEAFDAIKEAGEGQESQRKFAFTLNTVGQAFDTVGASLEDYFSRIQDVTRFSDDEARDAFTQLALITGDADTATRLLARSIDIAALSGKDLSEVISTLGTAVESGTLRGRALGIVLDENTAQLFKNASEHDRVNILLQQTARYEGGVEAAAGTLNDELTKLNNQWRELKEQLGALVLPDVVDTLGGVVQVVKDVRSALEFVKSLSPIELDFSITGPIGELFQVYRALRGEMEKPVKAPEIGPSFRGDQFDALQKRIESLETTADQTAKAVRQIGIPKDIQESTERVQVLERAIAELPGGAARFGRQLELAKARLTALTEGPGLERIAQEQARAAEAGTRTRLDAELNLLRIQERNELAGVDETSQSAESIRSRYRDSRSEKETEFLRAQVRANEDAQIEALQAEVAAARTGSLEKLRLETELASKLRARASADAQRKGVDEEAVRRKFDARELQDARDKAQQKAEIDRQAEDGLLHEEISRTEQGSAARLDLELQLLKSQEDAAVKSAGTSEEAIAAIRRTFDLKRLDEVMQFEQQKTSITLAAAQERLQAEQQLHAAYAEQAQVAAGNNITAQINAERDALAVKFQDDLAALDTQTQAERDVELGRLKAGQITNEQYQRAITQINGTASTKRLTIETNFQTSNEQLDRRVTQAKIQGIFAVAHASLNLGAELFGKNKNLAIANAIINTAEGVTMALATLPPPYSYVVAALTAAAGTIQIAKIKSTNPGGGSAAGAGVGAGAGGGGGRQKREKPPKPADTETRVSPLSAAGGGGNGDESRHQPLAYLGGRQWEDNWARVIGSGFQDRTKEISSIVRNEQSTSNDNRQYTYNYDQRQETRQGDLQVQGNVYGDGGIRRLIRDIRRNEPREDARGMQ